MSVVYADSVWAMNSTSSVACMSMSSEQWFSVRNVAMRAWVLCSNRARRMRGVRGGEVVETSVWIITRRRRMVYT